MASEIIAAADAGFQNIWSLQSCIDTLYEFGSEEQRQKYIPRICAGETMSMDLTEPDAGSDLQRVMLKATQDEDCLLYTSYYIIPHFPYVRAVVNQHFLLTLLKAEAHTKLQAVSYTHLKEMENPHSLRYALWQH